ncbi:BMC domain-containing protein [Micromonospora sp. WMMD1128]|uniref:BMC domain-containing protein n=1 Tax=unclassified Micromonospora TaxID=2617518 RepID=UPI00248C2C1E|nr:MULTISPECIES: BMC domain-containing protein [unclassified Micromonospora]WBB71347.1 BMC domain-containing protein [Micromonospora sp. WMMD1128]WFE35184.1 BMC domain-containing protein [Micromonospora sp. WMMD975]
MSSDIAIGIIETRGIVALSAGIEAMIKTADVRCVGVERVTSGYLAAAVRGTLAAVRQAVSAGEAAVKAHGELRSSQIYPKPHPTTAALLDGPETARIREVMAALRGEG